MRQEQFVNWYLCIPQPLSYTAFDEIDFCMNQGSEGAFQDPAYCSILDVLAKRTVVGPEYYQMLQYCNYLIGLAGHIVINCQWHFRNERTVEPVDRLH